MPAGTTVLRLEEFRKRQGVSLEQISDQTKIGTHFLRAIETEEFEKLPGGVFNTNYIRQYANAIGFSENALLEQYSIFERLRVDADAAQQAQVESRRGWTVRCANRLRTSLATLTEY